MTELSLTAESTDSAKSSGSSQNNASDTSDTEHEDGCGSPRVQRRRRRRNKSHSTQTTAGETEQDDLAYVDTLPEHIRLVEVTSNIWGTKFKIHGLATSVPANLGQVTYKTSLLHLQPRQMTLVMTELRDDFPLGPDPNFNPNLFSEDEEEIFQGDDRCRPPSDVAPPIAPMTPRAHHTTAGPAGRFAPQNRHTNIRPVPKTPCQHPEVHEGTPSLNANLTPVLAKAESYDDEFPYVDLTDVANFCESLRTNASSSATSPVLKSYVDGYCTCPQMLSATNANGSFSGVGTVTQYTRANVVVSTSGGSCTAQTRHAISPLVCEGAVPTLQSPKNAVAPSEVYVERGTPSQTLMTASTACGDFSNNVQRVKTALAEQNQNAVKLNLSLNLGTIEQTGGLELRPVVMKRVDIEGNNRNHQLANCCPNQREQTMNEDNAVFSLCNSPSPMKGCTTNMNAVNKRKEKQGKCSPSGNQVGIAPRPANKPEDILYIDEDVVGDLPTPGTVRRTPTTMSIAPRPPPCHADSMVRSCSVGYLDLVDAQLVPCEVALMMLRKETPKRLVLVNRKKQKKQRSKAHLNHENTGDRGTCPKPPKLKHCGKSRSLDSSDIFPASISANVCQLPSTSEKPSHENTTEPTPVSIPQNCSPSEKSIRPKVTPQTVAKSTHQHKQHSSKPTQKQQVQDIVCNYSNNDSSETDCESSLETNSSRIPLCLKDQSSVVHSSSSAATGKVGREEGSPHLNNNNNAFKSSSGMMNGFSALDCLTSSSRKKDLEDTRSLPSPSPCASPRLPRSSPSSPAPSKKSGKRNQSTSPIRKHLLNSPLLNRRQRKNKTTESSDDEVVYSGDELKRGKCKGDGPEGSPTPVPANPRRREFVMHNKAPMWNENSQVYQLDFGGRVTQESAKNFQIEFRGKQVMQFGRIDGNAYTLDFQYPFSALQAFAVALANVTQRLK
uniref:Tubby C-terminal domain-containing protein n=1 Tax=Timema shepardi TaxID=629360 RepID=A0A7R9AZK9_TIMSH|nr:unnamed protein product [Timema shepardi]